MTREEIIANCKIKTKEQFIQECKKNGIEDDWYNFSEEHTKPVSIGNEHVTYGIVGRTNCAFPETRWDEAMEHLLKYKSFVEWERSGSPLKIEDVEFKTKYFVREFRDGYATLCTGSQTSEPDQELLDAAYDNFYGSRSHILSDLIYASVLKTVGIAYDHKTNEWVKTI